MQYLERKKRKETKNEWWKKRTIKKKEKQCESRGGKIDQSGGAIWQHRQRRGSGHQVTLHSLTLSRSSLFSPFLSSSSSPVFSSSSSSPTKPRCSSRQWAPWAPARSLHVGIVIFFQGTLFDDFFFTFHNPFLLFLFFFHHFTFSRELSCATTVVPLSHHRSPPGGLASHRLHQLMEAYLWGFYGG